MPCIATKRKTVKPEGSLASRNRSLPSAIINIMGPRDLISPIFSPLARCSLLAAKNVLSTDERSFGGICVKKYGSQIFDWLPVSHSWPSGLRSYHNLITETKTSQKTSSQSEKFADRTIHFGQVPPPLWAGSLETSYQLIFAFHPSGLPVWITQYCIAWTNLVPDVSTNTLYTYCMQENHTLVFWWGGGKPWKIDVLCGGVLVGQFWLFVVILNSNQNAAGCFFPPTMVLQGSESINY